MDREAATRLGAAKQSVVQECGPRIVETYAILAFDTDHIGTYGI